MAGLAQALDDVRKRVVAYRGKDPNEQNTKTALIEPILRALCWDVGDLEEVFQEYKRRPKDRPVDYALLLLRTPKILVEAKALGQNLNDRKWANQIMGYAGVAGAAWVVLTDGDEYRIYNAHAPVPVEEKLFRSIRISDDGTRPHETLVLLSKEQTKDNIISALWNAHFVDRQIRAALMGLFSSDPDQAMVRLLKKRAQELPVKEIKGSLTRVRATFDFPIQPEAARAGRETGPKRETATPAARTEAAKKAWITRRQGKRFFGVSLKDIIDAGLLNPPAKLSARYKGHEFDADVLQNGTVRFQGTAYESCSAAADEARRRIVGGTPHTNGWAFWQYRDAQGKLVELDTARREYLKRKGT